MAVLRVDQTSCGAQRADVRLYHRDCAAKNTGVTLTQLPTNLRTPHAPTAPLLTLGCRQVDGATGCDAACYCAVSPCVLEASAAGNKTWFLGQELTPGASPDT